MGGEFADCYESILHAWQSGNLADVRPIRFAKCSNSYHDTPVAAVDHVRVVAMELLNRLGDDGLNDLTQYLESTSVPWASLCSGSDAPKLGVEAVLAACHTIGIANASAPYKYVAEFSARKRDFLQAAYGRF